MDRLRTAANGSINYQIAPQVGVTRGVARKAHQLVDGSREGCPFVGV
jgi:hypothetical protein